MEVAHTAEEVDEFEGGQPQRHGVDGEVPAEEVVVEARAEGDHRVPGRRIVGFGTVGGDLDLVAVLAEADRAERPADLPVGVGPAPDDREGLIRIGVGGEVEIG